MQPSIFKVTFEKVGNIRMSSPYNDVELTKVRGPVNLDFGPGLQDLFAEDAPHSTLYLVEWVSKNDNKPHFRLVKIDSKLDKVFCSEAIDGCCDKIEIAAGFAQVTAVQYPNSVLQLNPIIVTDFPFEYTNYILIK